MSIMDRIRNLASRGRVHRVDDSSGIQVVQVELLNGEIRSLQRLQDYGLTSRPLPGAETVALALNGDRSQSVIIKTDDRRHRITELQPGETCLYTDEGDTIHLKRDRKIEVNGGEQVDVNTKVANVNCEDALVDATKTATIKSPDIKLDGPVRCTNTLTVDKLITGKAGLGISGAAANINGAQVPTGGDVVTGKGTSVDTHQHTNGTNSEGNTGTPL